MNIRPSDILFRCGATDLLRYGRLTRTLAPEELTALQFKETFTRTSSKMVAGPDGVTRKVGPGIVGVQWMDASTPTLLLEPARTQVVTDPENFGAWTQEGTPILTSGQADPFGGTAAYLINDNDGAGTEDLYQALTFTGNGTKILSIFAKAGTSTLGWIRLRDNTASVDRHQISITWTAGVPVLATVGGGGTLFAVESLPNGWYRLSFSALSVVAANANYFQFGPAGSPALPASVGTTYFFGANAWNLAVPANYQGPSLGTAASDALSFPYTDKPKACWAYSKHVERNVTPTGGLWVIGSGATALQVAAAGAGYLGQHYNGVSNVATSALTVPTYGQAVELLLGLAADGSLTLRQSINGAADTVATPSGALALATNWAASTITLNNDRLAAGGMANAFVRLMVGLGTPTAISDVRSLP